MCAKNLRARKLEKMARKKAEKRQAEAAAKAANNGKWQGHGRRHAPLGHHVST